MHREMFTNAGKARGFTLIEVMIVVAIVGILAAIAYPSYQSSVRKSHRVDGKAALTQVAALQEKWFFQHNQYTADLKGGLKLDSSPEGYYALNVQNGPCGNTTGCFLLVATATGAQESDTECYTLTLDNTGAKHSYAKGGSITTDTANCW